MTDPYVEDEINLRDYWRVLVRRRFLIMGITLFAAVATAVIVLLMPNVYESKATLMPLGKSADGLSSALGDLSGLLPLGSINQQGSAERILAILNSRTVAEDVIQHLDLLPHLFEKEWDVEKHKWLTDEKPTMQDAVRRFQGEVVSITSDKKTGIITIAAKHTDSGLAAVIANQLVDALQRLLDDNAFSLAKKNRLFIEDRLQETREALHTAEETLRSFEQKHGIVSLDAQTAASVFSLNQAPEVKLEYARLQREASLQNKIFTLLVQQLEQAKIEEARDETAFQLLDKAIPSDKKVEPKRAVSVILAMTVSMFLGVFVAFFREFLDDTIRAKEQVERQLGLPLLATIPQPISRKARHKKRFSSPLEVELVLHQPPGASEVEGYRYLNTRLKHFNPQQGEPYVVLFTSAKPSNAVPIVLANLGIVAANSGEKTLLVDSNIRQPILHRLFQSSLTPGLADVLADSEGWHKGIHTTTVDGLHLFPSGTVNPTIFSSLESPVFGTLLTYFKENYDLILLITPPVLNFSDAVVLSEKVDATCLVITIGGSCLESFKEAKDVLEAVHANVVGAVLVDGLP